MTTTAIVAGGTGLVGGELIQLLLADPFYDRVVALVRRSMNLEHAKLIQVVTDYDNLEDVLDPSMLLHAHVFCTLGTTIKQAKTQEQFRKVDFEYPMRVGEMVKKHKADAYAVVTAMGANSSSSIFYNRVKGEVEEGLKGLELPALYLLRPSLILGDRSEARPGERMWVLLSRAITPLLIGGLRTYKPIQAKTIATGLINAVKSGGSGVRILSSAQITEMAKE
ncbi:NAD-dependent epimerase/dehydratase family protein [Paenibacillus sp. GCM10027628]|uniref:NAD-dependent epimerase/dehydratase family protein n=1 Tax=Paenibacillus sp. GCM10027628 TaxID=3273413 RepID=UPI0036400746